MLGYPIKGWAVPRRDEIFGKGYSETPMEQITLVSQIPGLYIGINMEILTNPNLFAKI